MSKAYKIKQIWQDKILIKAQSLKRIIIIIKNKLIHLEKIIKDRITQKKFRKTKYKTKFKTNIKTKFKNKFKTKFKTYIKTKFKTYIKTKF